MPYRYGNTVLDRLGHAEVVQHRMKLAPLVHAVRSAWACCPGTGAYGTLRRQYACACHVLAQNGCWQFGNLCWQQRD